MYIAFEDELEIFLRMKKHIAKTESSVKQFIIQCAECFLEGRKPEKRKKKLLKIFREGGSKPLVNPETQERLNRADQLFISANYLTTKEQESLFKRLFRHSELKRDYFRHKNKPLKKKECIFTAIAYYFDAADGKYK